MNNETLTLKFVRDMFFNDDLDFERSLLTNHDIEIVYNSYYNEKHANPEYCWIDIFLVYKQNNKLYRIDCSYSAICGLRYKSNSDYKTIVIPYEVSENIKNETVVEYDPI